MRMNRKNKMLAAALGVLLIATVTAGCNTAKQQETMTREQVEKMELELEQAKRKLAEQAEAAAPAAVVETPAQSEEARGSAPQPPAAPLARNATPARSTEPAAARSPVREVVERAAPKPATVTIPAGTVIPVRTLGTLSTKTAENGSPFAATLDSDLVVGGKVIAKKGADAKGIVVSSDPGGRIKEVASMGVTIRSIDGANGDPISVTTGTYTVVAKKTVKKDAVKVGIASGVGAAIGAIAGGGKGAAIGAGAGAGAGTGAVLATRGDPAVLPSESRISFRTSAPVTVSLK
jgi:hypothetical protein